MNLFRTRVYFQIKGENISRLVNTIFKNSIECRQLVNRGDKLTGYTYVSSWKALAAECDSLGMEYEIHEKNGFAGRLKWFKNRKGIVVGFIFGLIMITILSNTFLRLRIKTDNEQIRDALEDYILSQGISYGCFIPKLDLYHLEMSILQEVDEVSWVGIYKTGGTLNIDVVENVGKPEYNQRRLPSNLIAKRDGEIVSVEIFSGKLLVPVGSGVHAGQVIVSGEVELSEEKTVFRRSQGNVYAKVTYDEEFYCPFESEEKILTDNTFEKDFLGFYSVDIPLSIKKIEGLYIKKEKSDNLTLLGLVLPLSYKTVSYTEYCFEKLLLDEKQAKAKVYEQADNFKNGFLKDLEILEESEEIEIDENGVRLRKKYVVIENIAVEKEFLVK